ncbi:MAG TPA: hypothetical protein VKJ45_21055, partial [Blastocatellia bacterium]|nr:hypothetical protein [Blastocatellia bacterium]
MRQALQVAINVATWICFLFSVQMLTAVQAHSSPIQDPRHGVEVVAGTTAQARTRTLSGRIVTDKNESVAGVSILISYPGGQQATVSDADGNFQCLVPFEPLTVTLEGKSIKPKAMSFGPADSTENLQIKLEYIVAPIHESIVIQATALDPTIDRRNQVLYQDTLFG